MNSATASCNSSGASGQSTSPAIINGSRLVVRTRNSRAAADEVLDDLRSLGDDMLTVVEDQQCVTPAEELAQPLAQVARRTLSELHLDVERGGDRGGNAGRIGNRREVGHVHAVFELSQQAAADLDRQTTSCRRRRHRRSSRPDVRGRV